MGESTLVFPPPTGLLVPSGRQYRSTSGSPTRHRHAHHTTDELLAQLSPSAAIDAFRNPSGELKACLDATTLPEQSSAMRAVLAAKRIQEWHDELSAWSWPSGGNGSAGFDPAYAKTEEEKDELGMVVAGDASAWLGSIRASEVAQYEERVEEIQCDLHELDIEGIKNHVMHNHIMPLSRPGTPMSDSNRSTSSTASFNKMGDLTAIVTATVIQALPNLSRLTQLMNTWNVRLLILRRVPGMLASLEEAEVALQSGWNAINLDKPKNLGGSSNGPPDDGPTVVSTLHQEDFDIMKRVVEKTVARSAQNIDFMLDALDGRKDTVPDDWIDRMDRIEQDYSGWVAVCESKIRQAQLAKPARTSVSTAPESAAEPAAEPAAELAAEPELPTAIDDSAAERPTSSASDLTTILHEPHEPHEAETETPELPRMRNHDGPHALEISPPSSPESPSLRKNSEKPNMAELEVPDDETPPKTPMDSSFLDMEDREDEEDGEDADTSRDFGRSPSRMSVCSEEDQVQQRVGELLASISIPANIHLSSRPAPVMTPNHLNPPDLQLPHLAKPRLRTSSSSSSSSAYRPPFRSHSSMSSRAGTPSFVLAPAYARGTRASARGSNAGGGSSSGQSRGVNRDIKLYHLSRSTGEAPIKLFIRLVGDNGERVMVRVGGGWADLGEYLKEYAIHHKRRSNTGGESKVEVRDLPMTSSGAPPAAAGPAKLNSSPASRPASALDSPITPLNVRKTRRSFGGGEDLTTSSLSSSIPPAARQPFPRTPFGAAGGGGGDSPATGGTAENNGGSNNNNTPSSGASTRSRSSSRLSWAEEDSSLGMSGPRAKNVEMSVESLAWVESMKEKVRIASGEQRKPPPTSMPTTTTNTAAGSNSASALAARTATPPPELFGEIGKVGGTKRLFRKAVP